MPTESQPRDADLPTSIPAPFPSSSSVRESAFNPRRLADGASWNFALIESANRFANAILKRILDIFVVLLLMPVFLPLCGLISLLVILTSPGPLFFAHRRICRHGSFFSMWKFRTMYTNSAELLDRHLNEHPEERQLWLTVHKLRRDPRITPVGHFLRRYSLDDLPQLWNVLAGNMSLVGPKPIVAAEVQKYGIRFAAYTRVKPGITGLWQVSSASRTSYGERVALDCKYAQEWSVGMDMKILFLTVASSAGSNRAE